MNVTPRFSILIGFLCGAPAMMHAQFDFHVDGLPVQIHSFATQGFLYTNQNNYLTMPTSKGSFAMTDGGANISSQITDHFRVGAQLYMRNVGNMGNWKPTLDWGYGDYKFASWLGIRGGRVKTTLGLFNDVQDMDSIHTFAMLPSSIYPIDWRSSTIAHDGGDVYGDIAVKHLGTFSYTGYAGRRPQDPTSGYILAAQTNGIMINSLTGPQLGGDLRWSMPVGAIVGVSYMDQDISGTGTLRGGPYHQNTNSDQLLQYYVQYNYKGLRLDAEYRRDNRNLGLYWTGASLSSVTDQRDGYAALTYKISKHFEIGAYRSEYYVDVRKDTHPPAAHQFETVVAGRINFTHYLYAKIEGHFINGDPTTPSAARGFYTADNPQGILPTTNLLVVRTGFAF